MGSDWPWWWQVFGVCGTRCGTLWSGYGQFDIREFHPPQLSLGNYFLSWNLCRFQELQTSAMSRHIPLDLNYLLHIGIYYLFLFSVVKTFHLWLYAMFYVLFCKLLDCIISLNAVMAWYPAETDILDLQYAEDINDMLNEGALSMSNWIHLPIIVQHQGDSCSLSSKNGAVVKESIGQVAPNRFTILRWRLMTADAPTLPYVCSHLQRVCDYLSRSGVFLAEGWLVWRGRLLRHWSLQRTWLPLPRDLRSLSGSVHASCSILKTYRSSVVWPN